jgi:hypothetical protein
MSKSARGASIAVVIEAGSWNVGMASKKLPLVAL